MIKRIVAVALFAFLVSCGEKSVLPQGWTSSQAESFWFMPQGSKILPYRWFLALEMKDSQSLFRSDEHMDRLRYITTGKPSKHNPDTLPIGFTREPADETYPESLGMTCAACHTSELEIGGKPVLLDGGPGLGDYETFLNELVEALQATLSDDAKFQRFAAKAGGGDTTALRKDVQSWTTDLQSRRDIDLPTHPPGYGRVDALGNILNEVLSRDLHIPENKEVPDSPVSYPFIWDAHQHDFVQWNGSAPNAASGPVLRNIGEVLGVFGRITFTPRVGAPVSPPAYPQSSVNVKNLISIEAQLTTLWSPLWPQNLSAIDSAAASAGAAIYAQNCASCHPYLDRASPIRRIEATMIPAAKIGTDPSDAVGFLDRIAKTGVLAGSQKFVDETQLFGNTAPAADILRNAVFGIQVANLGVTLPKLEPLKPIQDAQADLETGNLVSAFVQRVKANIETNVGAVQLMLQGNPPQLQTPMYKGRPLNGVWATAPFLHNGSVPTLWDLLQDPEKRPKTFFVGSRKYDVKKVGYISVPSENGLNYYQFDTAIKGNSNSGHTYGTSLTDEQKWQLIEYIKTL